VTKPVTSLDTERIRAPLCFAKFVALNQPPSSYKAPGIFADLFFPSSWHQLPWNVPWISPPAEQLPPPWKIIIQSFSLGFDLLLSSAMI